MYLRAKLTRVCICLCAETATLSRYSNDVRTDLQTGSDLTRLFSVTIGIPLSKTRYFSIFNASYPPSHCTLYLRMEERGPGTATWGCTSRWCNLHPCGIFEEIRVVKPLDCVVAWPFGNSKVYDKVSTIELSRSAAMTLKIHGTVSPLK